MRTGTAKFQIYFGWVESVRQFKVQLGRRVIEAEGLATLVAGEMSVLMLNACFAVAMLVTDHKAPDAIIAGDSMRDADFEQPFQDPINRHPIDRVMRGNSGGHIVVRYRMIRREQKGEYRHPRLGQSLAGSADLLFCIADARKVRGLHDVSFGTEVHFMPIAWQVQFSRI